MYNVDSFYTSGKLHSHSGQDYALHGDNYFILCDGCSSANNSDFTSRLQAHIAKQFILEFNEFNEFNEINNYVVLVKLISYKLRNICNDLGLNGMPLATLMLGVIKDNKLTVVVFGDGVIAYKIKHCNENIIQINYSNNAPYYPYYHSNEKYLKEYKENNNYAVKNE